MPNKRRLQEFMEDIKEGTTPEGTRNLQDKYGSKVTIILIRVICWMFLLAIAFGLAAAVTLFVKFITMQF